MRAGFLSRKRLQRSQRSSLAFSSKSNSVHTRIYFLLILSSWPKVNKIVLDIRAHHFLRKVYAVVAFISLEINIQRLENWKLAEEPTIQTSPQASPQQLPNSTRSQQSKKPQMLQIPLIANGLKALSPVQALPSGRSSIRGIPLT
jgi:hypothetical protein